MTQSRFKKIIPYITAVFVVYFIYALYKGLTGISWPEVFEAYSLLNANIVLRVALLAVLNLLTLMCFDLLALSHLQEKVSRFSAATSALVSYILNLNFGALLGGVGVRYRLYSKIGVQPLKIHLIVIFSSASNWLAYLLIFGLITLISPPMFLSTLPSSLVKAMAFIGLVINFLYLIACFKGLSFNIKNTLFHLPGLGVGILQLFLGSLQWCTQGMMLSLLFRFFNIPLTFYDVLATFLVAAIAGVLTHIPSGLGVLEAVFLGLTSPQYHPKVLASLLCFRVIFYLFPLCFALPTYFYFEARKLFKRKDSKFV